MNSYFIAIAVILLCLGVLKLLNTLFTIKLKNHFYNEQDFHSNSVNLFPENISYKKYKNVAKRTSVRNSPQRKAGNFLDFLLVHICEDPSAIENNLCFMDCGEIYE